MIKSKVLIRFLVVVPVVTSLLLIGATFAAYIDPHTAIFPAFLGLAFPFILVAHVITCVVYFVLTKSRLIILFIVPLLASIHTFIGFFGINYFASDKKAENSFDLMTYNVHGFTNLENGSSISQEVFKLLEEETPDIICFQDFTNPSGKNKVISGLKKVLGATYFYSGPNNERIFPKDALGLFSRLPVVNSGYILLSDSLSGNQCIYIDVKKGDKIFRVYNVHLQSLQFQTDEIKTWENGNPRNKASFLKHNFRRLQHGFLGRSEHVNMMREEFARCKIPFIVAGDFNDSPASYAVNEMSRNLKNTFREKAKGYTVTYNGNMPNFQIDYILTQPVFKVNEYKVIEKKLSDHFPVKVNLSL